MKHIDNTWRGIGRLGKIHFVFNTYNMAIRGYWFDLIALYDGYNDEFIVVSDLYNVQFTKSSREALHTLFAVFGNNNKNSMINYEELYKHLRDYKENTLDMSLECNCLIRYIHSSNIQGRLNNLIEVKK